LHEADEQAENGREREIEKDLSSKFHTWKLIQNNNGCWCRAFVPLYLRPSASSGYKLPDKSAL
jgi:hypothetical protein